MKPSFSIILLTVFITRYDKHCVSIPNYNHYHPDLETTMPTFPITKEHGKNPFPPDKERILHNEGKPVASHDGEHIQRLVAWNCDLKNSLQYNEFSLMQVEDCDNVSSGYNEPAQYMGQVVQAKRFEDMSVLSCKLKASFYVAACSWSILTGYRLWSQTPVFTNMHLQLTRSECENTLNTQNLEYTDRTYYAKQNFLNIHVHCQNRSACTGSGWKTLRGENYQEQGSCYPDTFNLDREHYGGHVLSMDYDIEIKWMHAVFNTNRRVIKVNDHLIIPNDSTGSFFSPSFGNLHWDKINQGNLSNHHWLEIIAGPVSLYESTQPNQTMAIAYIYNAGGDGVALGLLERDSLCHSNTCRTAYRTQISAIYLVIYPKMGYSKWNLDKVQGTQVNHLKNLEMTMTSVYLTQELRLKNTFETISRQLCQRSRETILSNIQGYINNVLKQDKINDSRGRYFIKSGSVTYSVKCTEEIAWLRADTTQCYEDAPIFYTNTNNERISAFLDPITYIIKPSSPITKCNDVLPFKLNFMALDGSSEWICRTSLGWNLGCRLPTVIKPMQPRALYTLKDQTLKSTLYSQEQIKSLDDLQWDKTIQSVDLKEWESYLKRLRENNPKMPPPAYFENLHSTIQNFSEIFSGKFWAKLALKHIMPIIFLNYLINVALNMVKAGLHIKKVYETAGFSLSLIARALVCFAAACFPVFALSLLHSPDNNSKCRCEDPAFIDEITKAVTDRERQIFLKNLQL